MNRQLVATMNKKNTKSVLPGTTPTPTILFFGQQTKGIRQRRSLTNTSEGRTIFHIFGTLAKSEKKIFQILGISKPTLYAYLHKRTGQTNIE